MKCIIGMPVIGERLELLRKNSMALIVKKPSAASIGVPGVTTNSDGTWAFIKLPDPGAGNDWNTTVPAGQQWELVTVQWKVTTGVVTQDRDTLFNLWDSRDNVDYFRDPYGGMVTQGGGAIYLFNLQQGRQVTGYMFGTQIGRVILGSLPMRSRWPAGYTFGSTSPGRRIDDVITEIRLSVIKYYG